MKNRIFLLFIYLGLVFGSYSQKVWTNYKTTLILNKDGRFVYDIGYKYWKEKGDIKLQSALDSIYTGTFEKKFNKIILTSDIPFQVSAKSDSILNGTMIFIENHKSIPCISVLKIITSNKQIKYDLTDENGYLFIKEKIDSVYISLDMTYSKKHYVYSTFIDNKGDLREPLYNYWYPVFLKDTFYGKKIFIKFNRDIENKEKIEYQTIFKIKYFPKRLFLDEFDILYNGKSIKKGVFIDEKGRFYYKQNGIRLYF